MAAGVLVVAAIVLWTRSEHSSPKPQLAFDTAAVDHGAIRAKVTATGTVNPIVQVQVGTQVSGTIETLGADFNSEVAPGQMIAQIDPRLFNAAVEHAQANVLAARATTHKAKACSSTRNARPRATTQLFART